MVDDRLEQVERADRVRHHGLVRAVPRLADVRLRAEVEDVRLVGRRHEVVADQVVDRRLVGQVGEDDAQPVLQVADVVQRARRGRAHEGDHVGVQVDERLGQMRAHEAVGARDEAGAAGVVLAELRLQSGRARPRTRWLYRRRARMEGNRSRGRGAVRSGLQTGLSTAAVSGSAAVLGVILSRKFGHGVKTDGFFAAYGVYLALVLVAGLAARRRPAALRRGARRGPARRRGRHVGGRAGAAARRRASCSRSPGRTASRALLTSNAERARPGRAAPALDRRRRRSRRSTAASSRARSPRSTTTAGRRSASRFGSVAGVVLTLALVGHGVVAFGWGLALNGALSLAIPLVAARSRAAGSAGPDARRGAACSSSARESRCRSRCRGSTSSRYRFASGLGAGRATTFSYAYLIAAFLVSVTAASVALVATVPFAREGSSPDRVARHVVAIVVALARGRRRGRRRLRARRRDGRAPRARLELRRRHGRRARPPRRLPRAVDGRLGRRHRRLPARLRPRARALAAAARGRSRCSCTVLVEWGGRAAFGLAGVAVGLGVTTALVLAVLLCMRCAPCVATARGVALAAAVCGGARARRRSGCRGSSSGRWPLPSSGWSPTRVVLACLAAARAAARVGVRAVVAVAFRRVPDRVKELVRRLGRTGVGKNLIHASVLRDPASDALSRTSSSGRPTFAASRISRSCSRRTS